MKVAGRKRNRKDNNEQFRGVWWKWFMLMKMDKNMMVGNLRGNHEEKFRHTCNARQTHRPHVTYRPTPGFAGLQQGSIGHGHAITSGSGGVQGRSDDG